MSRAPAVIRVPVRHRGTLGLSDWPNFSATGSVRGMRKMYYGNEAHLVRCGAWIYKVPADVYDRAARL